MTTAKSLAFTDSDELVEHSRKMRHSGGSVLNITVFVKMHVYGRVNGKARIRLDKCDYTALVLSLTVICHLSHRLYSSGHLPASQRGRYLCQICPQVALRCPEQELHAFLVWRLRREPKSL